jgi:hypothetical protein
MRRPVFKTLVGSPAGDSGLRSSPGVTILNSAVPKESGQGIDVPRRPVRAPTCTFASLFCEKFQCAPEKLEEEVLWRCMQPRFVFVARLAWKYIPDFYLPDFHLINQVRDLTGVEDVSSEIEAFRYHHPARGFLRGWLRLRISGQLVVNLAYQLFKQTK